jgi:hypothetical protein
MMRDCADSSFMWRGTAILAVFLHGLEAHATEFNTVPIMTAIRLAVGSSPKSRVDQLEPLTRALPFPVRGAMHRRSEH